MKEWGNNFTCYKVILVITACSLALKQTVFQTKSYFFLVHNLKIIDRERGKGGRKTLESIFRTRNNCKFNLDLFFNPSVSRFIPVRAAWVFHLAYLSILL